MGSNDLIRVAPESGPSDFFEARLASLPVPVRVEYSAIRDLRAGFDGDGEAMGLLLGSSSPQALSIKRCELLALSPATLSDPKSLRAALHQFIRARLQTPLLDAPVLLGCFRTQTTGWAGIRADDLSVAKRSFPELAPLFLLIRTTQHRPWVAAIYALDAETSTTASEPDLEFPFDEYLLRNGYLTDLVETSEPVDVPVQPKPIRLNKTHWIIAVVLFTILLGGSAAIYERFRPAGWAGVAGRNASGAGPLNLKVNRSGKDFELSWDRLSAVLQQASSGTLTINDGALTRSVALTGAQLREGRILYTPLFEELTFRLEVANPALGATAESVQVLAWSGKQTADTLTIAPPDPLTNTPAHIVADDVAGPLSRLPETNFPGPPPVIPKLGSLKPENSKRDSGTNTPGAAVKSAPAALANIGKQPQSAKPLSIPEKAGVIQPSPPKPARSQDVAPAKPERVAEVSPPAVASERPPAIQPSPPPSASTPPAQTPASPAPKPEATAAPKPEATAAPKPPAAPAPKAEPPPVRQSPPAVTAPALPPPTVIAPAAAAETSPAVAPTLSAAVSLPVPIQRVAPVLPRDIPAWTTAGSPRSISIRVMVDSAGSVQNAEVTSSTPKGAFGENVVKKAALDAAKRWKFRPGQMNGKNVAAEYTIDFKFQ